MFGERAAADLRAEFGGTTTYVPMQPSADDRLTKVVGIERATALAELFGGLRLSVPLESARLKAEQVKWLSLAGEGADAIAHKLGCTERTVFRIRAGLREVGELPPLQKKASAK